MLIKVPKSETTRMYNLKNKKHSQYSDFFSVLFLLFSFSRFCCVNLESALFCNLCDLEFRYSCTDEENVYKRGKIVKNSGDEIGNKRMIIFHSLNFFLLIQALIFVLRIDHPSSLNHLIFNFQHNTFLSC